jgi:hypothetical protein
LPEFPNRHHSKPAAKSIHAFVHLLFDLQTEPAEMMEPTKKED